MEENPDHLFIEIDNAVDVHLLGKISNRLLTLNDSSRVLFQNDERRVSKGIASNKVKQIITSLI
jgi:hypothetical protein